MLPDQQLRKLQELAFDGKGEAFVESSFVTPLLASLGYEAHKDYEVRRHGDDGSRFKLFHPPVRNGAQRDRDFSPDYIPTIRKKMFWIIEAKSPKDVDYPFPGNVLVQGLQYCVHPEIRAKYLLITNGRNSAVYDAHAAIYLGQPIDCPILEFAAKELTAKWQTIYRTLSVETLRENVESDVKAMYDKLSLSSLDREYPRRLLARIGADAGAHSRHIEAHVAGLQAQVVEHRLKVWQDELDTFDADQAFANLDAPLIPGPRQSGTCFVDKRIAAGAGAGAIFEQLADSFNEIGVFRKLQSFNAICHLYQRTADLPAKARCLAFFDEHVDAELPLATQVECAFLRVSRKVLVVEAYPMLRDALALKLQTAPELTRYVRPPTALGTSWTMEVLHNGRVRGLISTLSQEALRSRLQELLAVEASIDTQFFEARSRLPMSEREIGGFEEYGVGGRLHQLAIILKVRGIKRE
jgi:hypothetical protein